VPMLPYLSHQHYSTLTGLGLPHETLLEPDRARRGFSKRPILGRLGAPERWTHEHQSNNLQCERGAEYSVAETQKIL